MITFPTSQIQNPVLPRRPSIRHGGARADRREGAISRHAQNLAARKFHSFGKREKTHAVLAIATLRHRALLGSVLD